jgi:tetratricopeptide (TPR) repeat protein
MYPEKITPLIPRHILSVFEIQTPPLQKEETPPRKEKSMPPPQIEIEVEKETIAPKELKDFYALKERGDNYLQSGFLSLAINDYSKAVEIDPTKKETWKELIRVQIAFRDYNAAEESVEKARLHFSNDKNLLILLGEIHIRQNEFNKAKQTFLSLPKGPKKDFYLGALYIYFGNYEDAKKMLKNAKEDSELKIKSDILLSAFEEFSLFPEGNPLHLRLLLAKAFNDLRFFEISIQLSKKILKEQENYRDGWIILGHSYLSLERYDLAKNVFNKAFELDPTKPETTFFLGLTETALKEYNSAITHLSMARENGYTPQADVTQALAEALLKGKFYDDARKEYEKLLDIRGASAEQYIQPVRISIDFLHNPQAAQKLARRAVTHHPDSETANNLLAWTLIENEKLIEAREILEGILIKNPDFAPAHLNFGKLLEKEKKYERALEEYKKAYDLSPQTEIGSIAAKRYNVLVLENHN